MGVKQLLEKISQKNKLKECLSSKGAPMVGIFWVDPIKKKIELIFADPVKSIELEPGGEFITGPYAHYGVWEQCRRNGLLPKKWKNKEYEHVPKGRVLYDRKKKRFKVFSSQVLVPSQWFRDSVVNEFNLQSAKTGFFGDGHYEDPLKTKRK